MFHWCFPLRFTEKQSRQYGVSVITFAHTLVCQQFCLHSIFVLLFTIWSVSNLLFWYLWFLLSVPFISVVTAMLLTALCYWNLNLDWCFSFTVRSLYGQSTVSRDAKATTKVTLYEPPFVFATSLLNLPQVWFSFSAFLNTILFLYMCMYAVCVWTMCCCYLQNSRSGLWYCLRYSPCALKSVAKQAAIFKPSPLIIPLSLKIHLL